MIEDNNEISKMENVTLFPILINKQPGMTCLFHYDINTSLLDDLDMTGLLSTELENFINNIIKSMRILIRKDELHPDLIRLSRTFNHEELVSKILYILDTENINKNGKIRFVMEFNITNPIKEFEFLLFERLDFNLQYYIRDKFVIYNVHPIGYASFVSAFMSSDRFPIIRSVFDLRVTDKNIETSREFYIKNVKDNLPSYLNYLKYITDKLNIVYDDFINALNADNTSNNICFKPAVEINIDNELIKQALINVIDELYDRRFDNPGSNERHIVYLDYFYNIEIDDEDESLQYAKPVIRILSNTDKTKTPHIDISSDKYETDEENTGNKMMLYNEFELLKDE